MSDSNFDKIFSILKKNSDEYIENNKNEDTKSSNNKHNKEIELETILPENKDIIEQEVIKPQETIYEEIMKPQETIQEEIMKPQEIVQEEIMIPNSDDKLKDYSYDIFENQLQSLMDQIIRYVSNINKDGVKVKLLDTNINEYTEDKLKECFQEKDDFSIYGKIQYNDNIENFEDIINDKTLLDFKF